MLKLWYVLFAGVLAGSIVLADDMLTRKMREFYVQKSSRMYPGIPLKYLRMPVSQRIEVRQNHEVPITSFRAKDPAQKARLIPLRP